MKLNQVLVKQLADEGSDFIATWDGSSIALDSTMYEGETHSVYRAGALVLIVPNDSMEVVKGFYIPKAYEGDMGNLKAWLQYIL